jgi:hypothetical protein
MKKIEGKMRNAPGFSGLGVGAVFMADEEEKKRGLNVAAAKRG